LAAKKPSRCFNVGENDRNAKSFSIMRSVINNQRNLLAFSFALDDCDEIYNINGS